MTITFSDTCFTCDKNIMNQMELFYYDNIYNQYIFFCTQQCRDEYTPILFEKKNICDICGNDSDFLFIHGKHLCSSECYLTEMKFNTLVKNKLKHSSLKDDKKEKKDDKKDTSSNITVNVNNSKSMFSEYTNPINNTKTHISIFDADDETICNYCHKYIKKSGLKVIYKNNNYYCDNFCFNIKNCNSNTIESLYDDDFSINTDELDESPPKSYHYNFWKNWSSYNSDSYIPEKEDFSKYIKDSKREFTPYKPIIEKNETKKIEYNVAYKDLFDNIA